MNIKQARKKAGLSQGEMSEKMLIPRNTISSWESERRKPPEWVERLVINELLRSVRV